MKFKALVIDLDGSVYHGNTLIERADEALNFLSKKYDILYLTNNSTRSRAEFARKLVNLGISCTKHQLITSGYASAQYIQEHYAGSTVYVIGEQGLKDELIEHDITICEEDCDCVLVGLDKEFSYNKMTKALNFILNGAVFIATNNDPFLITNNRVVPGAGSLVTAIETACGKKAIVTGKPSTFIADLIVKKLRVKPHEILIVGDNLQTDILMGIKGGMRTALVLTGASKMSDIERLQISPDYILKSIGELPIRLAQIMANRKNG
ncbi:MAG: HAD-IIA family hydrolase [Candidatus Methanospirareceae archaeon]